MKTKRCMVVCWAIALVLASAQGVFAKTYYVRTDGSDTANGSSPQLAWATISRALRSASAGDVVIVGGGIYTDRLLPSRDGQAGKPITISADTYGAHTGDSGEVIIRAEGLVLSATSADYLRFERITFDLKDTGEAVSLSNCLGVEFVDCAFRTGDDAYLRLSGARSVITFTNASFDAVSVRVQGGVAAFANGVFLACPEPAIEVDAGAAVAVNASRFVAGDVGVWVNGGASVITNSIFTLESVAEGGPRIGVRIEGGTVEVAHCTFIASTTAVEARGGTADIVNNIIYACNTGIDRISTPIINAGPNHFHANRDDLRGVSDHPQDSKGQVIFASVSDERLDEDSAGIGNAMPHADLTLPDATKAILAADSLGVERDALLPDFGANEYQSADRIRALPYTNSFEGGDPVEWAGFATFHDIDTTTVLGPYGGHGIEQPRSTAITLNTDPGAQYILSFDLFTFDTWDGDNSGDGPDAFAVSADGLRLIEGTISNASLTEMSFPFPPSRHRVQLARKSDRDSEFTDITLPFTAQGSLTTLLFESDVTGDDEVWALDNVSIEEVGTEYAPLPYYENFEEPHGGEWASRDRLSRSYLGWTHGPFDAEPTSLTLQTTPGQDIEIRFDLIAAGGWSGQTFEILADDAVIETVTIDASSCDSTLGGVTPTRCGEAFLGFQGPDALYKACSVRYTPARATTTITFRAQLSDREGPVFMLDNVAVAEGDARLPGLDFEFVEMSETVRKTTQLDFADPFAQRVFPNIAWSGTSPSRWYPGGNDTRFGVQARGILEIPEDGAWAFEVRSDDGVSLTIDGTPVVVDDSWHSPRTKRGIVSLSQGPHAIRVDYFQEPGQAVLELKWKGPDDANYTHVPESALFREDPLFTRITQGFDLLVETSNGYTAPSGIGFADFNNDGLPDLYLSGSTPALALSTKDGVLTLTQEFPSDPHQFAIIDIDNDGDLDIWTAGERLLVNDGTGTLTNIGNAGMPNPSRVVGVAAIDTDADGWIDPISFGASANWIGVNTGESPPRLVPTDDPGIGINHPLAASNGHFVSTIDYSMDGTTDILTMGGGATLLASASPTAWRLADHTIVQASGIDYPSAMDWGDFDNDGDMDLFRAEAQIRQPASLWRNDIDLLAGTERFNLATRDAGIDLLGATSRSCAWGDIDNDGDLDLVITREDATNPVALYLNNGDATFTDASHRVRAPAVDDPQDIALCDIDLDGDLDLAFTRQDGAVLLMRNHTNNRNGMNVRIIGAGAGGTNLAAIGVRVDLLDADGELLATRTIGRARGMGVGEMWAHFGGIDPDATYTLRAHFLSGPKDIEIIPGNAQTTFRSGATRAVVTLREQDLQLRRVIRWQQVSPDSGVASLDSSDADR